MIDHTVLVRNCEGEDDAEEWHLPNFGRDEDYAEMFDIYKRHVDGRGYAYGGGWAEQLAWHDEIIDLFGALDSCVKGPSDDHRRD